MKSRGSFVLLPFFAHVMPRGGETPRLLHLLSQLREGGRVEAKRITER